MKLHLKEDHESDMIAYNQATTDYQNALKMWKKEAYQRSWDVCEKIHLKLFGFIENILPKYTDVEFEYNLDVFPDNVGDYCFIKGYIDICPLYNNIKQSNHNSYHQTLPRYVDGSLKIANKLENDSFRTDVSNLNIDLQEHWLRIERYITNLFNSYPNIQDTTVQAEENEFGYTININAKFLPDDKEVAFG